MAKHGGPVAIVIGTSPNIGGGVALALAAAGHRLVCADLAPGVAEACAAGATRQSGHDAVGVGCDVRSESSVDEVFRAAVERFGRVDVVVNCAVRYAMGGLLDLPVDVWREQLDIVLTGSLLVTRRAVETMRDLGIHGSVVLFASTAAHRGQRGNIGYSTAKSGVLNLVRAAAIDAAPYRVRVNCVTPTGTNPGRSFERAREWGLDGSGAMAPSGETDEASVLAEFQAMEAHLPLGALPSADDYGGAVVFLASDAARMITGTELVVDAGTLSSHWVDLVRPG